MGFHFSRRSLDVLSTVHPVMQRIAQRAIQISPVDFAVTQGKRTREQQMRLYGKGRTPMQMIAKGLRADFADPAAKRVTNTMNSNHLSGRAIDIAPYVDGVLMWDEDGVMRLWPQLRTAFFAAANEQGAFIGWGGDWHGAKDRPHFELLRD